MKIISLITSAVVLSFSSVLSAQAAEYKGTCYFNSQKMPCFVNQNAFVLNMNWADGVVESYVHQGNGVYSDKRGGIWTSNPNVRDGILLEHKNGNRVGFVENR